MNNILRSLISSFIARLKGEQYQIDKSIEFIDLIYILVTKLSQVIRGFAYRSTFGSIKGILFLGRNTRIAYRRNIHVGGNLVINDNVYIHAMCKKGIILGSNVSIGRDTVIQCSGVISDLGEGLTIGNNVGINSNCHIAVRGSIEIGNDVIFGPFVQIYSENHKFSKLDIPIRLQGVDRKNVTIGDNVWVGANSIIMAGVYIGHGAVIAAGSIVTRNVESNTIVAGSPARFIKRRF